MPEMEVWKAGFGKLKMIQSEQDLLCFFLKGNCETQSLELIQG